jgi:unsaturated chondroitin disaccharide hydrolase
VPVQLPWFCPVIDPANDAVKLGDFKVPAIGRQAGKKYLDAALRLARKFNQELNGDAIPAWDFRLPAGEKPLRDTSAAAVVACGYQELEKLGAADALITKTKKSLLENLCADKYLNFDETCPGVLRDGQVGSNGPGSAQNAYMTWGDYYLMEALDHELHQSETWW